MKSNQNPMQDYFEYLDMLRSINSPAIFDIYNLRSAFPPLDEQTAKDVWTAWNEEFSELQTKEATQDETL